MNQTLKVKLEADVKDLQNGLKTAEKGVNNLDSTLKRGKGGFNTFDKNTQNAAKSVNKLGRATSMNAVPAMTSFSQVIQDSPYGIQGVANNIQQLTMQMGYLTKGAGGFNGALKAMGASLMGPTGILLGVSLVTTLLVSYGDELFKATDKTKKLKEETDKAAEALEDYVDRLNSIDRARIRGEQSAVKELVNLRLLNGQVQDVNKTQKERHDALEDLKKLYPSYLGNMTDEEILANGLGTAYDKLSESILKKARAQAAANIIVENEEKKLALQSQLAAKQVEINAQTAKQAKAEQSAVNALTSSYKEQGTAVAQANAKKQSNKTEELLKEQNKLVGQLQSIELDNIDLIAGIEDVSLNTDKAKVSGGKGLKVDLPVNLDPHNVDILDLEDDTAEMTAFVDNFLDDEAKIREAIGAAQYDFRLNEALSAEAEAYKTTLEELSAHSDEMGQILSGGLGGAINGITNDLMNGELTLKSFAESIVGSLSKVLASLVQYSIMEAILGKAKQSVELGKSQANAITIASSAAASMGPLGIAALPGLLATTMGTIGGAFAGIQAFADGGIVQGSSYSGDKVLARLNSGELVLNKMQQKQMGAMMTPTMMMNNQPMEIFGETRIEGDAIVVAYKRSQAKNNRYS